MNKKINVTRMPMSTTVFCAFAIGLLGIGWLAIGIKSADLFQIIIALPMIFLAAWTSWVMWVNNSEAGRRYSARREEEFNEDQRIAGLWMERQLEDSARRRLERGWLEQDLQNATDEAWEQNRRSDYD